MSKDLKLSPHEESFDVKPVGVRYICEFCNKGEMKYYNPDSAVVNMPMIPHKCTECGKIMHLPKLYPYIEWIPIDECKLICPEEVNENEGENYDMSTDGKSI